MLVLCPYLATHRPARKQIDQALRNQAFLIGSHVERREDREWTLKRWAREEPDFQAVTGAGAGECAVIRIYIQYLEEDPESDVVDGRTQEVWKPHRLSRIVTLWIPPPLSEYGFLLSVGRIHAEDVQPLMTHLLGEVRNPGVKRVEFSFEKLRKEYRHGWLHGCENRPGVIERAVLYGDFDYGVPSEVDTFCRATCNQEGVFVLDGERKVRVMRGGRFQILGLRKERFFDPDERAKVMEECFSIAQELLKCKKDEN